MSRQSKQTNLVNYLQWTIALFFVFDVVIATYPTDAQHTAEQNSADLSRPLSSILSNYHSDAEQISRSSNNFENKSNPTQTNVQQQGPKYEQQLRIVKRSPRTYNFGLGKRFVSEDKAQQQQVPIDDKQQQILENQIRKLLNYLYNLDINLIWNYLSNMNDDDALALQQSSLTPNKVPINEIDDDQDIDLNQAEKFKSKRDINTQRLYRFGIGKRSPQRYGFGLGKRSSAFNGYGGMNPRLDEYIKRRYSFGIGKRSD